MLRSGALVARYSARCVPRGILARSLAKEATDGQPQLPPKPHGNSAFVKRRRSYWDTLHEQRIAFRNEQVQEDDSDPQKEKAELLAARQARAERKRVKSEARQARAQQLLEETRVAKEARKRYRKGEWERKQKEVAASRAGDLQLLADHADGWITEETLDAHVERAVDEFFIEVREEDVGPRVVGW